MSVQLNAHNLTDIILFGQQKQLSTQTLLNLSLFSSQPCESISRDARSLRGPFFTMVNFIGSCFIRRSGKLSILNRLKYDRTETDLVFPMLHMHRNDHSFVASYQLEGIGGLDMKQMLLIADTGILHGLEKFGILNLEELNRFILNISIKC